MLNIILGEQVAAPIRLKTLESLRTSMLERQQHVSACYTMLARRNMSEVRR
jgi:hypothetical protein